MTAEEKKAKEIVEKFYQVAPELFGTGKAMTYAVKCAIIAVDEIINHTWTNEQYQRLMNLKPYEISKDMTTEYWHNVKSHLLKM
jgi:hypothetical protein